MVSLFSLSITPDADISLPLLDAPGTETKWRPPQMQFSSEIPTGILSQKPPSFFRELQNQVDEDDPLQRCQRYGYSYQPGMQRRRIFYGSLIAEEPWELLEIVAAESHGIYAGMVFVESNRTQNNDPRPVRRANNPEHIHQLKKLFGTPQLQVLLFVKEKAKFKGIRREHAQRQEILRGWKEMGMQPNDVGILADADETFTRDFLRAAQECGIPHLNYTEHECFTSKVKLAASSRVFETSPECVTDARGWYHPDMMLGACIELIGNRSIHPIAFRDGPRRAHGYGRACSHDFSKITGKHPLWNAADFRMLCGVQAYRMDEDTSRSTYTGFHFHNFFSDFNATRMKYFTYGHNVKANKAFASPLEDIGKNDLKLMFHCARGEPDDEDQKWKRIPGGLTETLPPTPIYFQDLDYRRQRHEWVKRQVRMDNAMVDQLQKEWILDEIE
jgi:Glycosyltransferase family 17